MKMEILKWRVVEGAHRSLQTFRVLLWIAMGFLTVDIVRDLTTHPTRASQTVNAMPPYVARSEPSQVMVGSKYPTSQPAFAKTYSTSQPAYFETSDTSDK